jgi:hypothetical protein
MTRAIKRAAIIRLSVSEAEKKAMPFGVYIRSVALKVARGELKPA